MKHIIVPIGSSDNAPNTLQYAINLAQEIDATVFVFRAYNMYAKAGTMVNMDGFMQRETKLYLRSVIANVDTKEVDIKLISAKGSVLDSIQAVDKELRIDLVVVGPKSNSIKDEVFLGNTSGSIVKQTEIPVLIVPNGYQFSPFKKALIAFKSGVIHKKNVLQPLLTLLNTFKTSANLLLVKTPGFKEEDLVLDKDLQEIKNKLTTTENATTYQGVLEHFQSNNPDLLCVFRRKRGFFKKLWAKNTVLKSEFYCNIPLLVLCGND